tara:strand:+ start:32 stop:619 length:588 start_codon:yes stop_codon:yes gene_type:complete
MKVLITLLALILLQSCSNTVGDIEKNLAETDKIYGKCNNPNRQFTYITKKICEDQERAAGPDGVVGDPINLTEIFSGIGGNKKIIYAGANSNQFLWNGALETLKEYPLMTVDSQGGFISTDWILEEANPDQRCMIKINITSRELISNGVNTKILCQKKETEEWYSNNEIFIEEEKNITLKILEKASQLSKVDSLS